MRIAMVSKQDIAETIKAQFASVKERSKILAQALKVRTDIAATRRRQRNAFAELGEEIYKRMAADRAGTWGDDPELGMYRIRLDGLKAELTQREAILREILETAKKGGGKVSEATAG
jgi:hypothetical protein